MYDCNLCIVCLPYPCGSVLYMNFMNFMNSDHASSRDTMYSCMVQMTTTHAHIITEIVRGRESSRSL